MIPILINTLLLTIFFSLIMYKSNKGIIFMSFLIPIEGYTGQFAIFGVITLLKLVGLTLLLQAITIYLQNNKTKIEKKQ